VSSAQQQHCAAPTKPYAVPSVAQRVTRRRRVQIIVPPTRAPQPQPILTSVLAARQTQPNAVEVGLLVLATHTKTLLKMVSSAQQQHCAAPTKPLAVPSLVPRVTSRRRVHFIVPPTRAQPQLTAVLAARETQPNAVEPMLLVVPTNTKTLLKMVSPAQQLHCAAPTKPLAVPSLAQRVTSRRRVHIIVPPTRAQPQLTAVLAVTRTPPNARESALSLVHMERVITGTRRKQVLPPPLQIRPLCAAAPKQHVLHILARQAKG
jgi:hypothetical protein